MYKQLIKQAESNPAEFIRGNGDPSNPSADAMQSFKSNQVAAEAEKRGGGEETKSQPQELDV